MIIDKDNNESGEDDSANLKMTILLPIDRMCADLYRPIENFHPLMINKMRFQVSSSTSIK